MNKFFLKLRVVIILSTLLILSTAYNTHAATSTDIIKNLGVFINKIEQQFVVFFDRRNSTSYRSCVNSMDSILNTYQTQLNVTTRSATNTLQKKAQQIAQYTYHQFNLAFDVIKDYNGKSKDYATDLASKFKRVFDFNRTFNNVKSKLQSLLTQAEKQQDSNLTGIIKRFIAYINQKRNEWGRKSSLDLFTGLCRRMDHR